MATTVHKGTRSGAQPAPLPGDVYQAPRDAIVSGQFQPNQRLIEADLVLAFQAGRTSIRSALTRLHQEGLVSLSTTAALASG